MIQELVERRRGRVDVAGTVLEVTSVRPDGVVEVAQASESGDVEVLDGGVGVFVVEPLSVDDVGVAHHTSATEGTQGGDIGLPSTDNTLEGVVLCGVMHEDDAAAQAAVEHRHDLSIVKRVASRSEVHLVLAKDVGVGTHEHRGKNLFVLHDVVVPFVLGDVQLPSQIQTETLVNHIGQTVDGVDEESVGVRPSGLNIGATGNLVHTSLEEVLGGNGSLVDTSVDTGTLVVVHVAVGHQLLTHIGEGHVHAVDERLNTFGVGSEQLGVVFAVGVAECLITLFLVHHRGLCLVEVTGREVGNGHGVALGVTLLDRQRVAERRTHIGHHANFHLSHKSVDDGEAVAVVLGDFGVDGEVLTPCGEVVEFDEVGVVQNLGDNVATILAPNAEKRGL